MKVQVIYDEQGSVYFQGSGYATPVGSLSYTSIDVPDGKWLEKVELADGSITPIFKEYPKTDIQLIRESLERQQADLDYLMLLTGE